MYSFEVESAPATSAAVKNTEPQENRASENMRIVASVCADAAEVPSIELGSSEVERVALPRDLGVRTEPQRNDSYKGVAKLLVVLPGQASGIEDAHGCVGRLGFIGTPEVRAENIDALLAAVGPVIVNVG